jgi:AraC family transcriptional activator of mtrCDE
MRHAADLLAANALSIDEVALNAGYQNRSSFTRTFRRYYGSDPSEYRARAQCTTSDSATPTQDAIEEFDAA